MNKAFGLICAIVILAAGQAYGAKVTNVELSWQDGFTVARLDVQGTVQFSHQTEAARDGKPYRVIVDLQSATHQLGQKDFAELPQCPVARIRTSQFSVDPQQVVRVVFDMKGETTYEVKADDRGVTVSFSDPQGKSFAAWSSATWIASQQPKPAAPAVAAAPTRPATAPSNATQQNQTINSDRLASLDPAPASTPTPSRTPSNASAAPSTPKPSVAAAATPAPSQTTKPATASPTATTEKATTQTTASGPVVPKPALPTSEVPRQPDLKLESPQPTMAAEGEKVPSNATKPAAPAAPQPSNVKPSATPSQAQPTVTTTPVPSQVKPTTTTPTPSQAKPTATTPAVTSTTEPKPQITPGIKPSSTQGKATDAGNEPASEGELEPTEEPAPEDLEPAVEDGDQADGKQRSTARFRRSANPAKIKGTLVAEFPTRLVIKYENGGRRDPFATLIDETKQYNSPMERRVPNVEGIRLVGVIESDLGNSALFEDKDGYGYILREGDKIQKGYVLRIQSERVYFQIFEYGWSRTVALNLENEY